MHKLLLWFFGLSLTFLFMQVLAALYVISSSTPTVMPERTLQLGDVSMEYIKLKGVTQTWSLQKICLDGQAYLLMPGAAGPNGISPSFKDGKPEQCVVKQQKQ